MQNGLPYTWAVIIPALANLAWGINVWATVPARPEQVSVFCVHLETANRKMEMIRKLLLLNYCTHERAHTLMIPPADRLE